MSIFRNLVTRLNNGLGRYTFHSDYRAALAIIESVYCSYASRINSDDSSRYLWRSICQYHCQSFARKKMMRLAANVVAFICLPFLLFFVRPSRKAKEAKVSCKYLKIDFHMA